MDLVFGRFQLAQRQHQRLFLLFQVGHILEANQSTGDRFFRIENRSGVDHEAALELTVFQK